MEQIINAQYAVKTEKRYNYEVETNFKEKRFYNIFKRTYDIIFSFLAMILLSPLILIIALLIRTDGGPSFYTQIRVGKNGKVFKMYKFRSMYVGADIKKAKLQPLNEMNGPVFKMKDDPRVTKIGKFIRKASIDELPQLINIFIGNMTFVGPRPPLMTEVKHYTPYQKQRLLVKQGLTCYWQCSGRNNLDFNKWVELDLKYIKDRSFWTDIKILFRTIPAVFSGEGAN